MSIRIFRFIALGGLTSLSPTAAAAQCVMYEADELPLDVGWSQNPTLFPGQRWTEGGWLFQYVEVASQDPWGPERDYYRRSIAEFANSPSFFMAWRVETDGVREGMPAGAPAIITASGSMGIHYHFTITRDQARLIDPYLNVILFDIQAELSHDYRLEVRDKAWKVFIDGQLVNSGTATKSYPTADSVIAFGAQAYIDPSLTRWDYIRYGVIPDDAGAGDLNCDGTINPFDIHPFVTSLISPDEYGQNQPACNRMLADINVDGSVNQFDIPAFIDLLVS